MEYSCCNVAILPQRNETLTIDFKKITNLGYILFDINNLLTLICPVSILMKCFLILIL